MKKILLPLAAALALTLPGCSPEPNPSQEVQVPMGYATEIDGVSVKMRPGDSTDRVDCWMLTIANERWFREYVPQGPTHIVGYQGPLDVVTTFHDKSTGMLLSDSMSLEDLFPLPAGEHVSTELCTKAGAATGKFKVQLDIGSFVVV